MPSYLWKTTTSGDWATATNWNPTGIPGALGGDIATINATGANYTITYDEAVETLNTLTINSANATLNFDANDVLNLSVNGTTTFQAGTIDLINNGATLNAGGLTASAGTTIILGTGAGLTYNAAVFNGLVDLVSTTSLGTIGTTINLNGLIEATGGVGTLNFAAITGTGTLEANGATLLVGSTLANATVQAVISNSAASVFETTGALFFGSNVPIHFLGPQGEFEYNDSASDTSVHFNITGLNAGVSKTAPTNFIGLAHEVVTISSGGTGFGTTASIVLSNSDTLAVSGITGDLSQGWVAETASDGSGGTEIFLASVCYAGGTRILTAAGEKAVESLNPGDLVITVVADEQIACPMKWLGHRHIDLANLARPETVAPVLIQRDAFAYGMPHRDLMVSPDHGVFVDGYLICARQLVNGATIRQEFGLTAVDYYHVELDQHAVLLAEGLPAESYLDTGNSGFFANSGAPTMLHPDLTDPSDYPTREAGSCAPFVWDEATVRPVWQRLADRAGSIGQPVPQHATTTDAGLRLLSDGRTVVPIHDDGKLVIFAPPPGVREVRLVSRAQSPTEARPWLEDRRRLGVRVTRIVLRNADDIREIPVDHPDLTSGWWAVERDGLAMSRWTNGEAVLPLPDSEDIVMLEIHLAGAMTFVADAALA